MPSKITIPETHPRHILTKIQRTKRYTKPKPLTCTYGDRNSRETISEVRFPCVYDLIRVETYRIIGISRQIDEAVCEILGLWIRKDRGDVKALLADFDRIGGSERVIAKVVSVRKCR